MFVSHNEAVAEMLCVWRENTFELLDTPYMFYSSNEIKSHDTTHDTTLSFSHLPIRTHQFPLFLLEE